MASCDVDANSPRPAANPLLTGPIFPTLAKLSLPNVFAVLAQASVAIAETFYMSRLGITPLAAMALVYPMIMLQGMLSTGAMGGGVSSAVSRSLGANNMAGAQAIARHAVVIALAGGLAFMLCFELFAEPILKLLGGKGDTLSQAVIYARTAFWASIFVWLVNTFISICRGSGNMKLPAQVMYLGAALHIGIGGALGLGWGPFPKLGVRGVAMGYVLAYFVLAVLLLWVLMSGRIRVKLSLKGEAFSWRYFRDILKVGAIACISPFQSVFSVLIITALVARYGTEALAGYGIGTRLEFLLVPITFAVGAACVPMVGMAMGAKQFDRARRATWAGGWLSAAVLGVIGLTVALWPQIWVSHYTNEPQVTHMAHTYLRWAGPAYAVFGLGLCLYFAIMGSGKVLLPVLASTARIIVIALGGYLLLATQAPYWAMFALVGLSMLAYGCAIAWAVGRTKWG